MGARQLRAAMLACCWLVAGAVGCEQLLGLDRIETYSTGGASGSTSPGGGGSTITTSQGGGSTTVSSTQGGGGTEGGGGTATMCVDPAHDCPAPSSECKIPSCDPGGMCTEVDARDGSLAATQIAGDCKKNVCVGGAVGSQGDDFDPLDDANDCTLDTCNAGLPESVPIAQGTTCSTGGGKVCDGNGTCVECNDEADCSAGNEGCIQGQCIPVDCRDGTKNGPETDIDCGGPCIGCDVGQACNAGSDCYHGVCGLDGTCSAATCRDGVRNGGDYLASNGETDVDCGGPCGATCGPMEGCNIDADCAGNQCTGMNGACVPNCSDQVENNAETDIDCGGDCSGCDVGEACGMSDSNCVATAYCDGGTCTAKKTLGAICASLNECATGNCADGRLLYLGVRRDLPGV